MQETNELFKSMMKMAGDNFVKSTFTGSDPKETSKAENYLILLLLGIFLFVGADAMKILLRTNFGNKSISRIRISIAALSFFIWGTVCLLIASFVESEKVIDFFMASGGQPALYIIAVFYFLLGIVVFSIGFRERGYSFMSKNHDYYGGTSILLNKLVNQGINPTTVHMVIEPLLVFSIGALFTGINIMLGLPILLSGLSLVLLQGYEKRMLYSHPIYTTLNTKGIYADKNVSEVN